MDNYSGDARPPVTYWPLLSFPILQIPANGVSGAPGIIGTGLSSAWTVGLYWTVGTVALFDPPGASMPVAPLVLGTGPGSTVAFDTQNAIGPGYFGSFTSFNTGLTLNTMVTLEIVVYPTAAGSYAAANYRIHSAPFTMPTVAATSPMPSFVGDYMTPFTPAPEPATLALAGLGLGALLMYRHKKT